MLNLPNELLLSLADHLKSARDINALARTNQRLYHLLDDYLYRHDLRSSAPAALHWAARRGREQTAQRAIRAAADSPAKTTDMELYQRSLELAAEHGHEGVVNLLISINRVDADPATGSRTPLSLAAESGHAAVVKLLLHSGKVNPQSRDDKGRTALTWAAVRGHYDVVKLLLDSGKIELDEGDELGRTPLRYAANGGHCDVIKLLLDSNRVNANSSDTVGNTALHIADKYGRGDIVQILEEWAMKNAE